MDLHGYTIKDLQAGIDTIFTKEDVAKELVFRCALLEGLLEQMGFFSVKHMMREVGLTDPE